MRPLPNDSSCFFVMLGGSFVLASLWIRDPSRPRDEAVARTLRLLAHGLRLSVRRVDLRSSSEPLSASDLAAVDHTLEPVSSTENGRSQPPSSSSTRRASNASRRGCGKRRSTVMA